MICVSDKSITKIQQLLQNAVNGAIKWFGQNNLTLNMDKCYVLTNKNIVDIIYIFINGVNYPLLNLKNILA